MHPLLKLRRAGAMLAVIVVIASGAVARSQQAPTAQDRGRRAAPFTHYPGGKPLAMRDAADAAELAAALRAEAGATLPPGVTVRATPPFEATVGRNRMLRFALDYLGVPVASSSDFVAIVSPGGALLSSRVRDVPTGVDGTVPALTMEEGTAAARTTASAMDGAPAVLEASAAVLEIAVDATGHGLLAWTSVVRARQGDPSGFAVRIWVSAFDGRPLASESLTRHATVRVVADTWQASPAAPLVHVPMPRLAAAVDGVAAITDDQGVVTVATSSVSAASATLNGQFVRVHNNAGAALVAFAKTPGSAVTLPFPTPDHTALAQTTAYFWAHAAHAWARAHAPALVTTPRNLSHTDAYVNYSGLQCNAFAAGGFIAIGAAGSVCRNMATPTIVGHEMGHEIHLALANGAFDAGFSEGFGDAVAAFLTGEPCLGPDLMGPGTCFRDVRDVTRWPVAVQEVHEIGRPYAQFAWQLRLALGDAIATNLVLGTAAAAPADVPDAVYLTFVADDDDGVLATCSPNQRVLEAAADSRTLPRPPGCRPAGSYQFTGFSPPIDMPTPAGMVWNSARAGQAIPAKWHLAIDGQAVADPASFTGLYSAATPCAAGGIAEDAIEEYAAGQSALQYLGAGQWQFNWKTPASYRQTCRVVVVRFADGTESAPAFFTFR